MIQAVVIYMLFASDVLLICWLGNQLTQHVRDNYLFYSKVFTYIMRRSLMELGNLNRTEQSVFFSTAWPFIVSYFVRI